MCSENLDIHEGDEEDDCDDEEEDFPRPCQIQNKHHVLKISWFEIEAYTPITMSNHAPDMSLIFDKECAKLSVGLFFGTKKCWWL